MVIAERLIIKDNVTQPKQLGVREVAKLLDVHPNTVRRWEREGKLVASRDTNDHRRFKKSDVEFLLRGVVSSRSNGGIDTEKSVRETELELIGVGKAAELLHFHPNTVRGLANEGLIPLFRVGPRGYRRFPLSGIKEFAKGPGAESKRGRKPKVLATTIFP